MRWKTDRTSYPQLQTSMAGEYLSSPSSSSGGRYHRVITLLVYGRLRTTMKLELFTRALQYQLCLLLLKSRETLKLQLKLFSTACSKTDKNKNSNIDLPFLRVIETSQTKICKLDLTTAQKNKQKKNNRCRTIAISKKP